MVAATFKLRGEKQTQDKSCDYQLQKEKDIFDNTKNCVLVKK